jgi:hypothetical protein
MILPEEFSTSPTSVEELSVLEYCKKDRSKELKPQSNYPTRRKSLELADETTPRHRANNAVIDNADIEGQRNKATLKGKAWLKRVLVTTRLAMCLPMRAPRSRPQHRQQTSMSPPVKI